MKTPLLPTVLIASLLGFIIPASAAMVVETPATNIGLECLTDPVSTTTLVETTNGIVTLRMLNHNGVEFMGIHSGVSTSNDIPKIIAHSNQLKKLGEAFTFEWPISACKQVENRRFHCFGQGEEKEINGHTIKGFGIDTGYTHYDNVGGLYSRLNVTLSVIIDGEMYSAVTEYEPSSCKIAL